MTLIALAALAGSLTAQATAAPTAAPATTGGAVPLVAPAVREIACLRRCARRRSIQAGSTIKIKGSSLETASEVRFLGGPGAADDIGVPASAVHTRAIKARVPALATSGPLVVVARVGVATKQSRQTSAIAILPAPPIIATPDLKPVAAVSDPSAPLIETGTSTPRTVFLGAQRLVAFSFRITRTLPASITVELVRLADGAVIQSWTPAGVSLGAVTTVEWNGVAQGLPQVNGRYAFRLVTTDTTGIQAASAAAGDTQRDAFDLYDHIFPIRGAHNYGSTGARFGAGRPGHSHQGQDVFAKCGTPLVAARGGVVLHNKRHSAAGNYLVIRGDGTGEDQIYMHMRRRSPFKTGDRVYTGQQVGEVGDTGRASGCHLHFELWSAPGWYKGGVAFDPFGALQAWDAVS